MTRKARIVEPGYPHHVVLKGVAACRIFVDDFDRHTFVRILAVVLAKLGARCLGWCLVGNHVHLVLVPEREPLADVVHRLATRYALYFNWRHARVGHLFQNRYWPDVIRSDAYLLNAVAYVPLNAVKSRMVPDLDALATFAWSGYASLMGHRADPVTDVPGVLALFGAEVASARSALRELMAERLAAWSRDPDWHWRVPTASASAPQGVFDVPAQVRERSEAVETAHRAWEERRQRAARLRAQGWTPEAIVATVCESQRSRPEELLSRSRRRDVCRARALVAFLATDSLLVTFAAAGRLLGVDESTARRAAGIGAGLAARESISLESLAPAAVRAP